MLTFGSFNLSRLYFAITAIRSLPLYRQVDSGAMA